MSVVAPRTQSRRKRRIGSPIIIITSFVLRLPTECLTGYVHLVTQPSGLFVSPSSAQIPVRVDSKSSDSHTENYIIAVRIDNENDATNRR